MKLSRKRRAIVPALVAIAIGLFTWRVVLATACNYCGCKEYTISAESSAADSYAIYWIGGTANSLYAGFCDDGSADSHYQTESTFKTGLSDGICVNEGWQVSSGFEDPSEEETYYIRFCNPNP